MSIQPEFFGKYILLEKLATGGMAEVYLAKLMGAENVAKYFAIKRILPQFSQSHEFIEMFKEEAKIAVNLSHSNVVSIMEFGEQAGQFYLSMEFVEGRNLRQILNRLNKLNQRLSLDQIIYIVNEVAKGLDHAHRCVDGTTGRPLNITHRDMSPQNVMISYEGEVKIVDFGIAKAESKIETTKAGTLKGKFGYMSPEQAEGLEVDFRTDIFSLGIVLWELIAGERLFISNNEINTLRKIKDCVIPSLRKIDPSLPTEIERITNKALARDRNLRYQSAAEFQRDLSKFLNRQFPDFASQDFSTFMKTIFEKERDESRGKMIEFAKITGPLGEKTEYVGDHTQTVTETNPNKKKGAADDLQLQNLISDDRLKSADVKLDIKQKRDELFKANSSRVALGETSGLTNKSGVGLPPLGTGISYTATANSASPWGWIATLLFLVALGYGGYYVIMNHPDTVRGVIAAIQNQIEPGSAEQGSTTPSTTLVENLTPPEPPKPTAFKTIFHSTPFGAEIRVDDKVVGTTPLQLEVPANKEIHVQIEKIGYKPYSKTLVFNKPGETVQAVLEKADLAYLNIVVRPAPEMIYIDRNEVGMSPITRLPVDANKQIEILAWNKRTNAYDRRLLNLKTDSVVDIELYPVIQKKANTKPKSSASPKRGTSSKK